MEDVKPSVRRCAVYTRKSSEEGLEKDFNSLHAQREACEAFIKSQAGEGWRLACCRYLSIVPAAKVADRHRASFDRSIRGRQ